MSPAQKASFGSSSAFILKAKTFSGYIAVISRLSVIWATYLFQSKASPSVMSAAPAVSYQHASNIVVSASVHSLRPMRGCDGVGGMYTGVIVGGIRTGLSILP